MNSLSSASIANRPSFGCSGNHATADTSPRMGCSGASQTDSVRFSGLRIPGLPKLPSLGNVGKTCGCGAGCMAAFGCLGGMAALGLLIAGIAWLVKNV